MNPTGPVGSVQDEAQAFRVLAPPAPCGCEATGTGVFSDGLNGNVPVAFTFNVSGIRSSSEADIEKTKGTAQFNHPTFGQLNYKFNFINCANAGTGVIATFLRKGQNTSVTMTVDVPGQVVSVIDSARNISFGGSLTSGSIAVNDLPDCP